MTIVVGTLDEFNRPDASTLGPNWQPAHNPETQRLAISGNAAINPGFLIKDEFWNAAQFGPDVEVHLQLGGDLAGTAVRIYVRQESPFPGEAPPDWDYGTSWAMLDSGSYQVGASGSTISLVRQPGSTTLGTNTALVLSPDGGGAIGIRAEGSTITALARFDATSAWEDMVVVTDTTYPDAGYVVMGIADGALVGGSGVGEGSDTPPPPTGIIDLGRRLLAAGEPSAIDLDARLETP